MSLPQRTRWASLHSKVCTSSQRLSDRVSSPTSRKTGLPYRAQRGPVDVLCCHILILTLGKSAALPEPAQCPGHQVWPRSCLGANEPYLLTFSISPRARPQPTTAGQRDAGVAAHVHSGPLQASWWPSTTKPKRAGNFLETSWNCSEQREKQPDSRGIHSVRRRGKQEAINCLQT